MSEPLIEEFIIWAHSVAVTYNRRRKVIRGDEYIKLFQRGWRTITPQMCLSALSGNTSMGYMRRRNSHE